MNPPVCHLTYSFFCLLHEACYGQCVIAGSAALAVFLQPIVLFQNGDCDIFIPHFVDAMRLFYEQHVRLHPLCRDIGRESYEVVMTVLEDMAHHYGITVILQNQVEVAENNFIRYLPNINPRYYHHHLINIHSITTFQLKLGDYITKKIQVIDLDNYPRKNQPWGSYVVSTFDADIVKVWLNPTKRSLRSKQFEVNTANQIVRQNIVKRRMVFTVRPGQRHEQVLDRLEKYMGRGFHLHKLSFLKGTPDVWKQYITQHLCERHFHLVFHLLVVRPTRQLPIRFPERDMGRYLRRFFETPEDEEHQLLSTYRKMVMDKANERTRLSLRYKWR